MIDQFIRRPLPALDFARRAFDALDALHSNETYVRDSLAKSLVEEVVPIAVFAKSVEAPEQYLTISYIGGVSAFDAEIEIAGAQVDHGCLQRHYYLEVVSAVAPYDYLEREALARDGFVFGGGNIHKNRKTKEIVSKPVVREVGAAAEQVSARVNTAIAKKAEKRYPDPCVLIVNVVPDFRLKFADWVHIVKAAIEHASNAGFCSVFLVETSRAVCYRIGN